MVVNLTKDLATTGPSAMGNAVKEQLVILGALVSERCLSVAFLGGVHSLSGFLHSLTPLTTKCIRSLLSMASSHREKRAAASQSNAATSEILSSSIRYPIIRLASKCQRGQNRRHSRVACRRSEVRVAKRAKQERLFVFPRNSSLKGFLLLVEARLGAVQSTLINGQRCYYHVFSVCYLAESDTCLLYFPSLVFLTRSA
uniref:Transmembrane protein n=1 Tax=Steinernema glaseri TaxID=37863 RepID=A0A1I7Z0U5_9BILA